MDMRKIGIRTLIKPSLASGDAQAGVCLPAITVSLFVLLGLVLLRPFNLLADELIMTLDLTMMGSFKLAFSTAGDMT
jgi:hypothetical protein